jgi:flagellar FliL protein
MSNADATGDTPAAPKKGLVGKIVLPVVLVLVGVAAGAAGALFAPKLLPAAHEAKQPAEPPTVAPLDYVELDNNFTATFVDSGRYVQLRIAMSTNGGKPVTDAIARHRLAIIAAVLSVVSATKESDLALPGGHDQLARQIRIAINDVLQRKSGLAGIDEVFITSFVIQ